MNLSDTLALRAGVVVAVVLLNVPAQAEQAVLEEIIVTAQKRAQSIQDVPVAITALDGAALENHGAVNITDVNGIAPNVVLQPEGLIPNVGNFAVRGISFSDPDPNADPKTGIALDGVFLTRNNGVLMDSFDIERVEILRGPQGTLYGRNNLAGTINMVTARPTEEAGGKIKATIGENGQQILRAVANTGTFADGRMRAKLSASTRTYDGYSKNVFTGNDLGKQEAHGGRFTTVYDGDDFDVTLIADYAIDLYNGPANSNDAIDPDGIGLDGDRYKVFQDLDGYSDLETWGVTVEANKELSAGLLTVVANYRDMDYLTFGDFDGRVGTTPPPPVSFHIGRDATHDQRSVEVRFADTHSELFDYVLGAYFIHEEYEQDNLRSLTTSVGDSALLSTNGQKADSYALFGQTDINLTKRFALVLGGRITWDEKSFKIDTSFAGTPIAIRDSAKWDEFTWKAGFNYFVNDDAMLYANVSTGYKGGGYNSRATIPANVGPYDPETVTSYEAGMKADFMDKRVRLNAAAFYGDYKDVQGGVRRPGANPSGTESISQNLGDSEVSGVELESIFLVGDRVTVTANLAYLHAVWKDFVEDLNNDGIFTDNSSLDLANSPRWSGYLGVDYAQPLAAGEVNFHLDARYTDRYNTYGSSNDDFFYRDEVALVNGHIEFVPANDRYSVSVYGKNLTDQEVISGTVRVLFPLAYYQAPREFGLAVQLNF